MKFKFLLVFFVLLLVPFYSCSSSQEKNSISQIRYNVFYGEQNGVCIKAYAEEKEFPFVNDGVAGDRENFVIVKVLNQTEKTTVTISYDKQTYTGESSYNAVSNSMDFSFKVKSLPSKKISVLATVLGESTQIDCVSMLKNDTISPIVAIEKVAKQQTDFISSLYSNGDFKAEIYVRLIVEGDYNFYYVGYAQGANKITAFLLDGVTGEIIAGKN